MNLLILCEYRLQNIRLNNMVCSIFIFMVANGGHMRSDGFRSKSLLTDAETKIEVLPLATHKPRHYLYAMLCLVFILIILHFLSVGINKLSR